MLQEDLCIVVREIYFTKVFHVHRRTQKKQNQPANQGVRNALICRKVGWPHTQKNLGEAQREKDSKAKRNEKAFKEFPNKNSTRNNILMPKQTGPNEAFG